MPTNTNKYQHIFKNVQHSPEWLVNVNNRR